jgi:hypothetical protein
MNIETKSEIRNQKSETATPTPAMRRLASRIICEWLETTWGLPTANRIDALHFVLAAELAALLAPRENERRATGPVASPTLALVAAECAGQAILLREGKIPFDCADTRVSDYAKFPVLAGEVGEVAREVARDLNMSPGLPCVESLRTELIQVAAVAVAWAESLQPADDGGWAATCRSRRRLGIL